jgi:hypothetical protein
MWYMNDFTSKKQVISSRVAPFPTTNDLLSQTLNHLIELTRDLLPHVTLVINTIYSTPSPTVAPIAFSICKSIDPSDFLVQGLGSVRSSLNSLEQWLASMEWSLKNKLSITTWLHCLFLLMQHHNGSIVYFEANVLQLLTFERVSANIKYTQWGVGFFFFPSSNKQ